MVNEVTIEFENGTATIDDADTVPVRVYAAGDEIYIDQEPDDTIIMSRDVAETLLHVLDVVLSDGREGAGGEDDEPTPVDEFIARNTYLAPEVR